MSDFVTIESGTSKALWDWYRASSCNLKHFVTNKWMHCTDIPLESSLRILSFTYILKETRSGTAIIKPYKFDVDGIGCHKRYKQYKKYIWTTWEIYVAGRTLLQ